LARAHSARLCQSVIPAQAGIQRLAAKLQGAGKQQSHWVPAYAGMTNNGDGLATAAGKKF